MTVIPYSNGLKITWTNKSNIMGEFFLNEDFHGRLKAYKIKTTTLSEIITEISEQVKSNIDRSRESFVFKSLTGMWSKYETNTAENEAKALREDMKLLSKDRKFLSLVGRARTDLIEAYCHFRNERS